MFCCLKQAPLGGESPIVFNRDLIKLIDPEILDKFRKKGIRYLRNTKHKTYRTNSSESSFFEKRLFFMQFEFFLAIFSSSPEIVFLT